MYHVGGPGWRVTLDISGPLLIALYVRELSGLQSAGLPTLSALDPHVRSAEPRQLIHQHGGEQMLRFEWEQWWSQLIGTFPGKAPELVPPNFDDFAGNPALQNVLRAHFGAALAWTRERISEYRLVAEERETLGKHKVLGELVQNREMELGRNSRDFSLRLIELPLAEPRAWFVEPATVLLSHKLVDDDDRLRSFIQPVIELLV